MVTIVTNLQFNRYFTVEHCVVFLDAKYYNFIPVLCMSCVILEYFFVRLEDLVGSAVDTKAKQLQIEIWSLIPYLILKVSSALYRGGGGGHFWVVPAKMAKESY